MIHFWQRPDTRPDDRSLCLIAYQGNVIADVFV
jgi:hypothetical protein